MIEKLIYLKSVDPLLLYGANNQHLELIKRFFPKIKLIARGDQLKAIGPAGELTRFEKKLEELTTSIKTTALQLWSWKVSWWKTDPSTESKVRMTIF